MTLVVILMKLILVCLYKLFDNIPDVIVPKKSPIAMYILELLILNVDHCLMMKTMTFPSMWIPFNLKIL